VFVILVAFCAACGDDDNGSSDQNPCPNGQTRNQVTGECPDGGDTGVQDTSSEDATTSDSGSSDTGHEDADAADSGDQDATDQDAADQDAADQDTGDQTGGTLLGVVTREASTQPEEDGVGNMYIAVFGEDPIVNQDTDSLVGFQLIEDADVSADTAEVPYRVEGIPPRAEPYYVTAFLDDDNTADTSDPSAAGPDSGDLVAVESFLPPSSPQVTVDQATEVELDLLLNFNMF
jgi:hypothetical protein